MSHPHVSRSITSAARPASLADWNTTWLHHTDLLCLSPRLSGWVHPVVALMAAVLIIIIEPYSPIKEVVIRSLQSPSGGVRANWIVSGHQICCHDVRRNCSGLTIKLAANTEVFLRACVCRWGDPHLERDPGQWRLGRTRGNPACSVINLLYPGEALTKPKLRFVAFARRHARRGWDTRCVF